MRACALEGRHHQWRGGITGHIDCWFNHRQGLCARQAVQLKKGDYVLRVHLRHDSATLLGQLKSMPLVVERQLGEPITVPVYATNNDAIKKAATVRERALFPGGHAPGPESNQVLNYPCWVCCLERCAPTP